METGSLDVITAEPSEAMPQADERSAS